ncbi:MAG: ATP-binding protein, partial [Pseudanabaenales cyanobacterium]|nr:ATP-binding protein [Pseudanabaenales cyanobacterium]
MAIKFTERFFNTAGPVRSDWHYLIDPLSRWDMDDILQLIAQGKYFVLHAPRQTGKTSCLLALMERLNAEERYQAVYTNIETAQTARNDVARGIEAIAYALAAAVNLYLQDARLLDWRMQLRAQALPADDLLRTLLTQWASQNAKPIVLILDEVDALVGDTLISLLRQLRGGYAQRPQAFPISVILCGVRDVRDYRIHTSGQEIITGGS